MKALEELAALLVVPPWTTTASPSTARLQAEIATLHQRVRAGSRSAVAADQQRAAVQRFWAHPELDSLKDARRVAFGVAMPLRDGAPALIDNEPRFQALLQQADRWREQPRAFRRIVQGLLHGYFICDAKAPATAPATRANWDRLRRYLDERCQRMLDPQHNPDWVPLLLRSRHLLGERPGEPYAAGLLQGDFTAVTEARDQLGIPPGSWFWRELVQAQLNSAVALADEVFATRITHLLALLAQQPLLRDTGLRAVLERCAALPRQSAPHDGLLQVTLRSWGDPATAQPDPRWGGMSDAARAMFAGWLTQARIAAFFAHAPEGTGTGMRRRAAFWQRYAPAIQALRVALDPRALPAANGPFALLLKPLAADVAPLAVDAATPIRHALLMTLGAVTLVEFSSDDALHVYDSAALPFAWPGPLQVQGPPGRSLQAAGRLPAMAHLDGHAGWQRWEAWFEATLAQQFELRPGETAPVAPVRHVDLSEGLAEVAAAAVTLAPSPGAAIATEPGADAHWRTAEAAHIPYSRADLEVFARAHGLPVEDRSAEGGGLWVLSARLDAQVGHVLARWGFAEVAGSGWRK